MWKVTITSSKGRYIEVLDQTEPLSIELQKSLLDKYPGGIIASVTQHEELEFLYGFEHVSLKEKTPLVCFEEAREFTYNYPLYVYEYQRREVEKYKFKSLVDAVLEEVLEQLDNEYLHEEIDLTVPSEEMRGATKLYLDCIFDMYRVSTYVPTGLAWVYDEDGNFEPQYPAESVEPEGQDSQEKGFSE